jgi:ERCC4-type nuclease
MCEPRCLIRLGGEEDDVSVPVPIPVPVLKEDSTATLIIDYRESALQAALKAKYRQDNLHVGDMWIGCSAGAAATQPHLVLERKTIADWESSVMDGRYREQRGRLLAFSQETGARIAYVLEGSWRTAKRLGAPALMKLVARMQLVHGIPVFFTASVQETAALVEALQAAWEKDGAATFAAETSVQRVVDGIKVAKKDNLDDPRIFAIRCIAQCPGMSPKSAEAILDGCGGTLAAVMAMPAAEIAAIKNGGRKIGPAVAGRLVALLAAGTST